MKLNLHLKIAIGIIVVFGLLLLGFALWTPVRLKYYAWRYRSSDVSVRVKAVDGLIELGEPGIEKLKAIYPDGPKAAKMLVECGDDVGCTSLHRAARWGYIETVELLIFKGADVNANNNFGRTPLHSAAIKGRTKISELLISKSADVNATDVSGWTPLHYSAQCGHTKTAGMLISKLADVNVKGNIIGKTPLHLATEEGHTKTVALLISKGADVNATDDSNWTPLERAINKGYKKIEMLLRAHGAKNRSFRQRISNP